VELAAIVLTPITFGVLLVLERTRAGRRQPAVRGWTVKGSAWFLAMAAMYMALVPALGSRLAEASPLHMSAIAAPLAFALADAIGWFTHHAIHRVRPLWRWMHQLHHSPERVDVAGALYLHPLDATRQIVTLAVAAGALGLSRGAAALVAYLWIAAQLFVHANLRTPQRLGWIIQRPEAHAVHHARGLHAYNYGLLTIWDRMFGTLRNPRTYGNDAAGFWDGSSRHVLAMLVGREVRERSTNRGELP
jgi:sterol desaturase/sphingolipid hydroxylase (fatty acid hydroxylase superfamily)